MKKIYSLLLIAGCLAAGCSNNGKKIIVYGNNDIAYDEASKTFTQKDTSGHVEKEIDDLSGKITFTVKEFPSGSATIDLPDPGYYIVNLKARDTIIGGLQKYSTQEEANRVMTQAELAHNIDSLKQMVAGHNENAANKTFFILPNTATKITDNMDATIVGPYHRMTSVEQTGDKAPEVYRFYSIHEVRETIEKLEKLTGNAPADSTGKK